MTDTDRDVARRRRRWVLWNGGGQIALLSLVSVSLWISSGWAAGLVGVLLVLNVAVAYRAVAVQYRLGYWRGRSDVHLERLAREGVEPPRAVCTHAEPWSPAETDGIDLVRAFLWRSR